MGGGGGTGSGPFQGEEEGEREQEALRRDIEYAQQRVRLRLLERQEQIMRIARDLSNQDMERTQFGQRQRVRGRRGCGPGGRGSVHLR